MKSSPKRSLLMVACSGMLTGLITGYPFFANGNGSLIWLVPTGLAGAAFVANLWLLLSKLLSNVLKRETAAVGIEISWPLSAILILPLLYLPYLISYDPNETLTDFFTQIDIRWQALLVLAFSAGLVASLLFLKYPHLRGRAFRWITSHPGLSLAVIVLLWVVITSTLEIVRTYNFQGTAATGVFNTALNNPSSEHGPFFTPLIQANGSSLFGIHGWLILYLIYPIYQIWPKFQWLFIMSNIALGLAAVPIFLIARRFFQPGLCILLVLLFLLNRTIIAQSAVGDISEERFLPVLFLTAFYFWHLNKFWPFMIFALTALMVREDVGLVLAVFGILSLRKRDLKWFLVPTVIGVAWFIFITAWFVPHFNPSGTVRAVSLYGDFGTSGKDLIVTFLTKPWLILTQMFSTSSHTAFTYGLWESFGFGVPLLSGAVLFGFIPILETLLLGRISLNHFNGSSIAATLFPGLILGLVTLNRFTKRRYGVSAASAVIVISLFATLSLSVSWFNPSRYTARFKDDSAKIILETIPVDASVILPRFMVPMADPRQDVRNYHQITYEVNTAEGAIVEQDYVVIDAQPYPEAWLDDIYYEGLNIVQDVLRTPNKYVKIIDMEDLQLYKRVESADPLSIRANISGYDSTR